MKSLRFGIYSNMTREQQDYYDKYIKLDDFLFCLPSKEGRGMPESVQYSLFYNFAGLRRENYDERAAEQSYKDLLGLIKYLQCWENAEEELRNEGLDEDEIQQLLHIQAKHPFDETMCVHLREDLQAIELDSLISRCFLSDEKWLAVMKVVAPNIEERNPLLNVMARVVDWCLANPVLIALSWEKVEGPEAEAYHKLVTEEIT